jgi:hypothetical protein
MVKGAMMARWFQLIQANQALRACMAAGIPTLPDPQREAVCALARGAVAANREEVGV